MPVNLPKISVIIPVYNAEKYLRECLDSVINQTLKDIEIICINDGSTDSSIKILQQYAEKDSRIKVLTQENMGPGRARNLGLEYATGDYVYFVDADDYLEITAFEILIEHMLSKNLDICICRPYKLNALTNERTLLDYSVREDLLPKSEIFSSYDISEHFFQIFIGWPWDKMYKRELLADNDVNFPNLYNSEDTYFVYKAMAFAKRMYLEQRRLIIHREFVATSVSRTRETAPDAFITSLEMLRQCLKEKNIYKIFEKSFVNYFLTFSNWHLNTISENNKEFLYKECKKYFQQLHFLHGNYEESLFKSYMNSSNWKAFRNSMKKSVNRPHNIVQNLFSIKDSENGTHKVCTIMGIKFKIRRNYAESINNSSDI